MVRPASSDRQIARTRAIGLRREPQPPMPMVMPGRSSATTASAVISFCLMTASPKVESVVDPAGPGRSRIDPPPASQVASACLITWLTILSDGAGAICAALGRAKQAGTQVEDMTREPADRHQQILTVAAVLFARKGVAATTVREIADEVGILSGSLYHHFDSKEAMVDEILAPYLNDLREAYKLV